MADSLEDFTSFPVALSDSADEEIQFQAVYFWVSQANDKGRLQYTDELFPTINLFFRQFDKKEQFTS